MKRPLVTALMPVYNGEKYLREAIDSILAQTFTDFEFLIINDGSKDQSEKIIRSYKDKRIRLINNTKNLGFSATVNRGLDLAKGKYIARMDCDDLSAPTRLEKQVAFMEKHPDYGVCGTLFALIDENRQINEMGGVKMLGDEDLKTAMLFGNVFAHGETMIRKSVLDKYHFRYNPEFTPCEDYDLWARMSEVTKFKTLQEVLYFYMVHPHGMSGVQSERLQQQVTRISTRLREKYGLPKITAQRFINIFKNGRTYKDHIVTLPHIRLMLYLQLAYQVFLFRLGKIYLDKKRFDGIFLIVVSVLINPLNVFKHLFKLFPEMQSK